MKRFIFQNVDEKYYNAASKARRDADIIAKDYGYESIPFSNAVTANHAHLLSVVMAVSCIVSGIRMLIRAEKYSVVLLQYPQFPIKASYFLRLLIPISQITKRIRFAALIHDLNSLRGLCGRTGKYCDRKVLPLMDAVICHNEAMKRYLLNKGISEDKLITLGLFDYLSNAEMRIHSLGDGITVAGNLDPEKCGYIDKINNLPIHLYGNGRSVFPDTIIYHGSYPPEELPGIIEGAFGLVWDGNSADGCQGDSGHYLRFNNPHKLSLYLASGMPVIVWKEAAVARYVEEKGVGFAVDSLSEIPDILHHMQEDDYEKMRANAEAVSEMIRKGQHLKAALKELDEIVEQQI